MVKDRIIFSPTEEDRLIRKDGKTYRHLKEVIKDGHIKDVIFEEINEEEFDKRLDKISEYLTTKSGIDAVILIKDALRQLDTETINRIEKAADKEEPVEIKHGCLSLKIGKHTVPIFE